MNLNINSVYAIAKALAVIGFFGLFIAACNQQTKPVPEREWDRSAYVRKGDSLVKMTFDTLRNTLLATIQAKGVEGAVRFCNINAMPVTASFASERIHISRVTDRPRNPGNALTEFDRLQFDRYRNDLDKGDSLAPAVIKEGRFVHYYKPILVQAMCLNCHGQKGTDISLPLSATIDSLYPSDAAKGYRNGQLRGMWHVKFADAPFQ